MCLAIPAKLVEINGNDGKVEIGGTLVKIALDLVDDMNVGDYVIVHAGFALEKIDEEEAVKRLSIFEELAREGHVRA